MCFPITYVYIYIYTDMSAYFYICTHPGIKFGWTCHPQFFVASFKAESQSKPESESPAPLRRGPAAPLAPVDGNDSWKNTKRTWKIRRLNFSTVICYSNFWAGFSIFFLSQEFVGWCFMLSIVVDDEDFFGMYESLVTWNFETHLSCFNETHPWPGRFQVEIRQRSSTQLNLLFPS